MREETIELDITVVGGGLSGVCAAIAAARLGRKVALIQNRPVLGGNSSSEIRVWVSGASATGVNRYARESGIMGELYAENQYRNPDGNPYIWDLVVLEAVLNEPNIQLFLNTDVHEVVAFGSEDARSIQSVTGWMMGSERKLRFLSPIYLDCTGDGLIGFMAGAEYRVGREARSEYQEEWAPEIADNITLGSTILFYTKDAGHPVKFFPPSFAKDIAQTSIPMKRVIRSGDSGCHYWWIEWGGELDTVHENERIRDELWAVIYGIWDYIKNSGQFDADCLTLEWVGSIPGKREYRRLMGDYVLNQNDIVGQYSFHDRVAYGGWSIDLHPPEGMYSALGGSKHLHADGIYHIPFRSLYSRNVTNLLFAGRNVSASHIAFGTIRVMATCAVMGEAAGTGAALCVEKRVSPREVCEHHLQELQQRLLRGDASIIGIANKDERDLARIASRISSTSHLKHIRIEEPAEVYALVEDAGIIVPVDPVLDGLEILVTASEDTILEVEVWDTGRAENYIPHALVSHTKVEVIRGELQWVTVALYWKPEWPQNAFIIIKANSIVKLHLSHQPVTGVLSFVRKPGSDVPKSLEDRDNQPVIEWSMKPVARKPYCFRMLAVTGAYEPGKVIDGYHRPYGSPHLWVSEPVGSSSESLLMEWDVPVGIGTIHLTFNDDPNEYLNNLHFLRTPFNIMPELVRDYRLEVLSGSVWIEIADVRNNRKRKRIHTLEQVVKVQALKLTVLSTHGSSYSELVEIRVYNE